MHVKSHLIPPYNYQLLFKTAGEETLSKKLKAFLEGKNSVPNFPFIIFSDHFPLMEELNALFIKTNSLENNDAPLILVLKNKNPKDRIRYWEFLEFGFEDVIEWYDDDDLISFLQSRFERHQAVADLLNSPLIRENLIGESKVWKNFLTEVIEAALFSRASILLLGESGTGKELVSRLVHTIDQRTNKKKLIIVDCTTIAPELSGSELFGHERGSYTSAIQSREGAFALANGGTLFLDEVGELPMSLQSELLRVLQEGTYKKVGSNTWQKTDFRLVCATNKDLRKAVDDGRFRQDLYFRLADCEFTVPALSQRKDDIALLADHFISKLSESNQHPKADKAVMDLLVKKHYAGNVRELKQLVQRIMIKHVNHKNITIGEVPANDRSSIKTNNDDTVHSSISELIRKALLTGDDWWHLKNRIAETAIQVALDIEKNNKQKAAERLGVDVRTVQQYVKKHELKSSHHA